VPGFHFGHARIDCNIELSATYFQFWQNGRTNPFQDPVSP
jgi:hypothetical protein